jgi:hypothetical protein
MSVSEFNNANLAEVTAFIKGRIKFIKEQINNDWAVMRWQSTLIANMTSKKQLKPIELFLLDGEIPEKEFRDPHSDKTKEVLEKMRVELIKRKACQQ